MIITRTPLRISFFGGGTDYPAYFRRHGGETLVTSIDKFFTATVQKLTEFFGHSIQVHYSRVESVNSVDEIKLPAVRETLRYLGIQHGVEVHLVGDLPARTGLGSSSATTVGLLTALYGFRGQMVSEERVAAEAVTIEQELMGEIVGCQDQYACACGGFLHLQFMQDGRVQIRPVIIDKNRRDTLEASLMMFYTGMQRTAHEVLDQQIQKTSEGTLDRQLALMKGLVRQGLDILTSNQSLGDFGELLHEGWEIKRSLSNKVSNPMLDEIYGRARAAGARGGKLLGAGAGGFFLFYVDPEKQASVRQALREFREVDFHFEPQGTRVVFYRP